MTLYAKINDISYLSSPAIDQYKGTSHAFLCRTGGVSVQPYESLNFDARDTDTTENVKENTRIASAAFGVDLGALYNPNQVHGDGIVIIKGSPDPPRTDADSVITNVTGQPIGIQTADCQPILFFDPINKAIGAAHAGWKGTALSIAVKTIEAMKLTFGTRPEDLLVTLGPCIGPCCYEIGSNVIDKFERAFGRGLEYIITHNGKARLDIPLANRAMLFSAGVKVANLHMASPCTSCNVDKFFSYRKEHGRTGRQLSFIVLK